MEDCIRDLQLKLKVTEKESEGIVISSKSTETAVRNGNLCLVGKLFAKRFVGGEVVFEAMRKAWMVRGTVEFKSAGNNLFFFQFDNRDDLMKVKYGGPWHVD